MRRVLSGLVVLATFVAVGAAHAACDPSVQPVDGQDGYQVRDGNRCEGLYVSQVSGSDLELVSLTWGAFPGQDTPPAPLQLWVPLADRHAPGPFHVRAQGIPAGLYYRMDADLKHGGPVKWPRDPVMSNEKITYDQIGLFAFADTSSGEPIYTPVSTHDKPSAADPVVVQLRALTMIDGLQWRFVPKDQPAPDWQNLTSDGESFTIQLPGATGSVGTLQVFWNDPGTGGSESTHFDIEY